MKDSNAANGPLEAMLLIVAGMAIIGLIDNFVVEIARDAGLWQFHAIRAVMALPMIALLARVMGGTIRAKRPQAIAARSFFLAASMLLYFGSIPLMPISIVVACLFTSPGFVLIFSILFFGLRVGWVRILSVLIGFCGVILVLDPFSAAFDGAMLMPVAAGALYAMSAITARQWCAEEDTLAMLMGFFGMLGVFGLVGLLVMSTGVTQPEPTSFLNRGWTEPTPAFLFWCVVQAAGSIVAVGFLTRAYQTEEASRLVVLEYTLLVFASFWGYILYAQSVSPMAIAGMALIVTSGTVIARRNTA